MRSRLSYSRCGISGIPTSGKGNMMTSSIEQALRKLWLAALVVILACSALAVAGCGEDEAKRIDDIVEKQMNKQPEAMSTSLTDTFESKEYGVKIKYPGNWTATTSGLPAGHVVEIVSPVEGATDTYKENVSIIQGTLPSPTATLDDWLKNTIEKLKVLDPDYTLTDTTIAGQPAKQLVVSLPNTSGGTKTRGMQVYTVKGDKVYYISYVAAATDYSRYSPTVEAMIKSFEFI